MLPAAAASTTSGSRWLGGSRQATDAPSVQALQRRTRQTTRGLDVADHAGQPRQSAVAWLPLHHRPLRRSRSGSPSRLRSRSSAWLDCRLGDTAAAPPASRCAPLAAHQGRPAGWRSTARKFVTCMKPFIGIDWIGRPATIVSAETGADHDHDRPIRLPVFIGPASLPLLRQTRTSPTTSSAARWPLTRRSLYRPAGGGGELEPDDPDSVRAARGIIMIHLVGVDYWAVRSSIPILDGKTLPEPLPKA